MKIEISIDVQEIDSKKQAAGEKPKLSVERHALWNDISNGLVILSPPNGRRYTVRANDLIEAAKRCIG